MKHIRCDIAVVGAGPGGIAAASAAAEAGRKVVLIDQAPHPGGNIWRHVDSSALPRLGQQWLATLNSNSITVLHSSTVVDAISPTELVLVTGADATRLSCDSLILATGASELLLPFPGWTLPGVVGVGGLQALLKNGLDVRSARVVLAGSGPLLLPVAASLRKAGANIVLIAEQAALSNVLRFGLSSLTASGKLTEGLQFLPGIMGARSRSSSWPLRATGGERLEAVVMSVAGREETIACDWLATSAGLVPRTELAQLLGCHLTGDAITVNAEQQTSVSGVWAVGECCGVKGADAGLIEGRIAGLSATGQAVSRGLAEQRKRGIGFGNLMAQHFAPRSDLLPRVAGDTIICRCEDVTAAQLDNEPTQRSAKLNTRLGMGACQGATCGPACRILYGWDRNAVRPPLDQPPLGAWASAIRNPAPPGE